MSLVDRGQSVLEVAAALPVARVVSYVAVLERSVFLGGRRDTKQLTLQVATSRRDRDYWKCVGESMAAALSPPGPIVEGSRIQ